MENNSGFSFPAIRGIQAGKEYYVSMCQINIIPKLFDMSNIINISPELRAQRLINKSRIPLLKRYILNNPDNYVFSSLTASIDGETEFIPLTTDAQIGKLNISKKARFIINDGQHRKAAIEAALKENKKFGYETISIVFFLDSGLKKSQQMFADLNRYAAKPSTSLNILYDYRDPIAMLVKEFIFTSSFYSELIEMERTSLSERSKKLFTLSAIYRTTVELLNNHENIELNNKQRDFILSFWEDLALQFKEWQDVKDNKISASEVRKQYLHCYGVFLQAFGRIGSNLYNKTRIERLSCLKKLRSIDWSRQNIQLWEGRVLIGGKVSKNRQNIILIANVIKQRLSLPLLKEESEIENAYLKGSKDG
ncbi:MAG: DNA sulfur modification protein DndB [Spirochaetales bacterium]|nr:DNA sulfur modification protein DndB [Spirochaetales bacterium]